MPTADWEIVRWAWDKRNTYQMAEGVGIPIPWTRYPMSVDDLSEFDSLTPPFAIKPAIKEHFIYATRVKAWCANSHVELRQLVRKALDLAGPGEVMVQEVIPGGGSQQYSYCAFFRDGSAVGSMVARRRRQHPLQFGRASTYVQTVDVPLLEEIPSASCGRSTTTGWSRSNTSSIRVTRVTSCSTSTLEPGVITV